MTTWDWIFGIVGIFGTIFGIYAYYKTEINKTVEAANNSVQQEKLRNLHTSLVAAFHAVDGVVQASKKPNVTADQLGDMARVVRGLIYVMAKDTETEVNRLRSWRFGRMIHSDLNNSETTERVQELTQEIEQIVNQRGSK